MQRSAKQLLIGLGIVALIVVIAYSALLLVTENNRAAKVAQVRKPATIDAYERLVAELYGEQGAVPVLGRVSDQFTTFRGFPEDWEVIVDSYDYLFRQVALRMSSLPGETGDILGKELHERTDTERSKLAEFFLANQDVIEEIRRMAQRGAPVYPLDFSKGVQIELPHLARMRQCARLLREDAIIKAAADKKSEAVDDIIAGMKLGDALVPEPIIISQLLRIAIYGIMSDAVQNCFEGGDLPPERADELMSYIAQADNRRGFADSLAGELYMGLVQFSEVRASGWSAALDMVDQATSVTGVLADMLFVWLYKTPLGRPWANMDEAAYADILSRVASAAELPYYEAMPILDAVDAGFETLPRTRILTRLLVPALSRACQAQARHEAMLDLMQMGILLEQYKVRTDRYPESLDAIIPDLGSSVPVDPFSGGPYHYQLSGDSFILYSIGRNRQDDGGRHDLMASDIVWRGQKE